MDDFSTTPHLKVVILGDSSCGKTSLLTAWTEGIHEKFTLPTIGAACRQQMVQFGGDEYYLNVWDTAGQDNYRSTLPLYCRSAYAVMIVFDLTIKKTFENIVEWIKLVRETGGDIPFVLVGNKKDLDKGRAVEEIEIGDFASKYGVTYYETSALTGCSVEEAFVALSCVAISKFKCQTSMSTMPLSFNLQSNEKKPSCC